MRSFGGSLLLGLSAATFFLSPVAEPLLRLTPAKLYFLRRAPERLDYLILLGLVLAIGLIAGFTYEVAPRFGPWLRRALEVPLWLLWVLGLEHVIHLHLSRYPPLWNSVAASMNRIGLSAVDGWFVVGFLCSLAVLAGFYLSPRAWTFAKPFLCGGAAVVWLGCAWKLVQTPSLPPETRAGGSQVRQIRETGPGSPVVWIILDEWDYDLTYRRNDGKVFPEFDRLRQQAMFLENVRSAGKATLIAIPSLLTGKPVRDYRPASASAARFLSVTASEPFPASGTIFDTANQLGYRSQIVGWYHTYCRMFGSQVDSCWWDDLLLPALRPGRPVLERASAFLRDSIELEILPVAGPTNNIIKQLARVNPMIEEASRVAQFRGWAFSFLHLPVPHAPFFKLDENGQMIPLPTDAAGYQSGLDAADRAVGKIRAAMEQSGAWDEALVVVTSDHPYRYQFGGGYGNGHIPMMIKFPHQSSPVLYSGPFQAVETRRFLEDFMQGKLATAERAVTWMDQATSAHGKHSTGEPRMPIPEPVTDWGNP